MGDGRELSCHHAISLDDYPGEPEDYPDFLLTTLCANCHSKSEQQEGLMKWPLNSRGKDAKPERLEERDNQEDTDSKEDGHS